MVSRVALAMRAAIEEAIEDQTVDDDNGKRRAMMLRAVALAAHRRGALAEAALYGGAVNSEGVLADVDAATCHPGAGPWADVAKDHGPTRGHVLKGKALGVGAIDYAAAAVIDDFVAFDPTVDVGAEIKRLTAGAGVDVVYDAVGGVTTPAALAALARRGRLVVISVVGSRAVEIDLLDLYRNETRIFGTDSTKLTVVDSARRLKQMAPYFESGEFRPLPIAATYSLDDAASAYQAVADHIAGRVVIRP